jgi:hypothetical protein
MKERFADERCSIQKRAVPASQILNIRVYAPPFNTCVYTADGRVCEADRGAGRASDQKTVCGPIPPPVAAFLNLDLECKRRAAQFLRGGDVRHSASGGQSGK